MILAIILLTAGINIVLGIISYTKNPKSTTHRLLTILTFIFALWTVANYYSLNSPTANGILFWIRMVMFITIPMGPVLYLFAKAFPGKKLKLNRFLSVLLLSSTILLMGIAFTPLIYSSVSLQNGIHPTPGPAIGLFGLLLISTTLAGLIEFIRKYRKSSGIEKLQLRYVVSGIVVSFGLLILTNFLFVVLLKYTQLVILGPMFTLVFVGFVFYAIVRHRLLAIRFLIARSVAYTLLLSGLATVYILGVFSISHYLFFLKVDIQQLPIFALLALFIALTFERLKDIVENLTEKMLFQGRYNSDELILDLTTIIASTLKLKEIAHKTLHKLISVLRITHGCFVIFGKNGKYLTICEGDTKTTIYKRALINKLYSLSRMAIYDEETNPNIKQIMEKLNVAISLPLVEQGRNEGLLLLGEKKSGQIYTEQDIKVLEIFGPEISIAIQNASAFEKISRFNITLRDKINKATQELQTAHEKLQMLDKQKDEFLGIASHELKTPITSIKAYAQVLHKLLHTARDKKHLRLLEGINEQADRLTSLINDLLNISHIEAGKLILKKEKFDFDKLVTKTIQDIQYTTETHAISKEGKIKRMVIGDESRIEQVLSNLLTNAIKYSPNADKVMVKVTEDMKNTLVSVTDFGSGISKNDLKKIFERYYRVKYKKETHITGFGLGLYIASEIIKRHGGDIWVESDRGKGSTFYFTIPT